MHKLHPRPSPGVTGLWCGAVSRSKSRKTQTNSRHVRTATNCATCWGCKRGLWGQLPKRPNHWTVCSPTQQQPICDTRVFVFVFWGSSNMTEELVTSKIYFSQFWTLDPGRCRLGEGPLMSDVFLTVFHTVQRASPLPQVLLGECGSYSGRWSLRSHHPSRSPYDTLNTNTRSVRFWAKPNCSIA